MPDTFKKYARVRVLRSEDKLWYDAVILSRVRGYIYKYNVLLLGIESDAPLLHAREYVASSVGGCITKGESNL